MIREALLGETCTGCGAPLVHAGEVRREAVRYRTGEFGGEAGIALVVGCRCGMPRILPLSAEGQAA